jgi:tryptophanyl-tRNA synthetase
MKSKEKKPAPVFKEPAALIVQSGSRVMSLIDGTQKMSKSHENDLSRINLLDSPDLIAKKIKRCKTDAMPGITWDPVNRPEATNLLNILQSFSGQSQEEILQHVIIIIIIIVNIIINHFLKLTLPFMIY